MSGVGEAFLDGVPMLVVSGGIRTDMKQSFQLHDVDQQALMRPLTKAQFKIDRYEDAIPMVYEAYKTAVSGEPGPVFIEVPANLQLLTGEVDSMPPADITIERPALDEQQIRDAATMLSEAEKPGLFVGWGARHVTEDLQRIAERLGAPVATTLQGLASFPGDHPLHTGMGYGPSAVPAARNAFAKVDCLLADVLNPPDLEAFDLIFDRGGESWANTEESPQHNQLYENSEMSFCHVGSQAGCTPSRTP